MQLGDKITFGAYKWRALRIQDNTALIVTEDIVEKRPYHNTYEGITWTDCDLRKYLNSEFYENFSTTDKSKIITVTNSNFDNPWYGTKGGGDTKDRIFLLDIGDVVCKYFGDSSEKLYNRSKSRKYWFGNNDENNIKRVAKFMGHDYWWWLRSPGRNNKTAAYIHGDPGGNVGINGNSVFFPNFEAERNCGVRPALWLRL